MSDITANPDWERILGVQRHNTTLRGTTMSEAINEATEAASNADAAADTFQTVDTVEVRADEWRDLLEARQQLRRIEACYISLGSSLHGAAVVVGICSDFADELARGEDDGSDKIEELIADLQERGYGRRSYTVTIDARVFVPIEDAMNDDDACEQAEEWVRDHMRGTLADLDSCDVYDVREED
jgi:hypothetical protein